MADRLGYFRIILAIASLYYMPLHPRTCSILYSISCLLDALDGYAARYFEQSTQFGGVLDMVTDRCTTACMLVFLSQGFPRWSLLFQGLLSLDVASHYIHMYATLTMGGAGQSHKKVDSKRSRILNLYYTNKVRTLAAVSFNRLTVFRLCCSFSAPSMSCFSLLYICCPSPRRCYLHRFSSNRMIWCNQFSQVRLLTHHCPSCFQVLGVLEPWNSHVPTKSTQHGHGDLLLFPRQS